MGLENEIKAHPYFNKIPEGYAMLMQMHLQGKESYRLGELQEIIGFSSEKLSLLLDILAPAIKPCWKEENGKYSRALKLTALEKEHFKRLEKTYGREALEKFVKEHQAS